MKNINLKAFLSLAVVLVFAVASCSKDSPDVPGILPGGNAAITMDIDGKPWKAMYAVMMTTPPDEEDREDYVVAIVGSDTDLTKTEDEGLNYNGLTMAIEIPKSKFRNPVGVYEVRAWNNDRSEGLANAWFVETFGSKGVAYFPFYKDSAPVVGKVNISKFEIGTMKLPDEDDFEGYTKLVGTFSMDLTQVNDDTGSFGKAELKITNGKFDLKSGFDFGGLFFGKALGGGFERRK